MEKISIIGGTPEEKITQTKRVEHLAEQTASLYAETKEKTEEQLKWIDMVNEFLAHEIQDLGLEYNPIQPNQVKFIDETADDAQGRHGTLTRTILINTEEIKKDTEGKEIDLRLKVFAVLLHESLHESGHVKYDIRDGKLKPYRVGYNLMETGKLLGFNEGITDLIVMRLMDLNKDKISEEFGVKLTTEEDGKDKNSVWNYINRRDAAVLAANVWHGDFDTLWRGYFTGNMMHLRKIEEKYGKWALRVLSLLDDGEETDGSIKIKKIYRFFDDSVSQEERDRIRLELLNK